MKKYLISTFVAVVILFGVSLGVHSAQAFTQNEADTIINILKLPADKVAFIRAIATPNTTINVSNFAASSYSEFKRGQSYGFEWIAPKDYKKVGILLRNGKGDLVTVINNGDVAVTSAPKQNFTLVLPATLPLDYYYVTIYPVGGGLGTWNTSVFKVVQ